MLKPVFFAIRCTLLVLGALVLGQLIEIKGQSLSQHMGDLLNFAQRSRVVQGVKDWGLQQSEKTIEASKKQIQKIWNENINNKDQQASQDKKALGQQDQYQLQKLMNQLNKKDK